MTSIIDEVQRHNESVLEKLWKEFQETLQEYINSTEDKHSQYAKLKTQDEASTDAILKHCKILTNLYVSVNYYASDYDTSVLFRIKQLTLCT
jgi:hypothetical protein